MTKKGQNINDLIMDDKYDEAEVLIRKELKMSAGWEKMMAKYLPDAFPNYKDFDAHWLWSQLSVCYYERRKYKTALKYVLKALSIAPYCPMVRWEYAGTLTMLGQNDEAIEVYKGLLRIGAKKLAERKLCGEDSLASAEGVMADCRYRIGRCYEEKGDKKTATKWLKLHLRLREKRSTSIYTKEEVVKALEKLQK